LPTSFGLGSSPSWMETSLASFARATTFLVRLAFLLYLARLSYPRRLMADMERMFGMRKSSISASIRIFSSALYRVSCQYLEDPSIWLSRMPLYAELIRAKSGNLMLNIWGFLDATIRRTRRPVLFQRRMYTGAFDKVSKIVYREIASRA
jgi:hypothetical protein